MIANSVTVPKIITTTLPTIDYRLSTLSTTLDCNITGVPGITPISPCFVLCQLETTVKSRFNGICTSKSNFTEFIDEVFLYASGSN
jgi:hypothetical protein